MARNSDNYFKAKDELFEYINRELPLLSSAMCASGSIDSIGTLQSLVNYTESKFKHQIESDKDWWRKKTKQIRELHKYIKDNKHMEPIWVL